MFEYPAELVRIVDGDTLDAEIDLGFGVFVKKRIRLFGIDTCESRTRDLVEKKKGLAAKARLKEILQKKQKRQKNTYKKQYKKAKKSFEIGEKRQKKWRKREKKERNTEKNTDTSQKRIKIAFWRLWGLLGTSKVSKSSTAGRFWEVPGLTGDIDPAAGG